MCFPTADAQRAGVQRGSVMDMPTYPGDPLTPQCAGRRDNGSTSRTWHADEDSGAADFYADAQPLLAALKAPCVPESWRGALRSRITSVRDLRACT
jgi:N-acetylated-alpha-linked acidic dipeptidase